MALMLDEELDVYKRQVQLWGSSRQTRHKNCGSSMGATATKLAMRAFSSAPVSYTHLGLRHKQWEGITLPA